MEKTAYKDSYISQLNDLNSIIVSTNDRLVSDLPDMLIYANANFFTKSFLVMMCAYLESYLKDASMVIIDAINARLSEVQIPYNLLKWSIGIKKDFSQQDIKFENFNIKIKKNDIDDFISGSPHRTKDLFIKLGIQLEKDEIFQLQRELINSIVVKRNRVIHHNDDASDLSNQDLQDYITAIIDYLTNLDQAICNHLIIKTSTK